MDSQPPAETGAKHHVVLFQHNRKLLIHCTTSVLERVENDCYRRSRELAQADKQHDRRVNQLHRGGITVVAEGQAVQGW